MAKAPTTYFFASASSSAVGPSSAMRFTTSRTIPSVSDALSERVAVWMTSPVECSLLMRFEVTP